MGSQSNAHPKKSTVNQVTSTQTLKLRIVHGVLSNTSWCPNTAPSLYQWYPGRKGHAQHPSLQPVLTAAYQRTSIPEGPETGSVRTKGQLRSCVSREWWTAVMFWSWGQDITSTHAVPSTQHNQHTGKWPHTLPTHLVYRIECNSSFIHLLSDW